MTAQMAAVVLSGHGEPDTMRWGRAPVPELGPDDVRIFVAGAGVNRADILQRQGSYPPPRGASPILGLECSGVIGEVGANVEAWRVGDEVCALLAGGGYAEQVVVPSHQVLPVPDGVDLVDAAALPEAACTVWSNISMHARLQAGETFLVHGGAGGIGSHAIQVAKALGATVAATAGNPTKLGACRELGADTVIDHRREDFVAILKESTPRRGADVILDSIGGSYLARNVKALAPDGRLLLLGTQGATAGELDILRLMAKRGTVHAASLRTRPATGPGSKAETVREVIQHVWPLIEAGQVRPVIHARVPIAKAAEAHELLDSPTTIGKVIISVT